MNGKSVEQTKYKTKTTDLYCDPSFVFGHFDEIQDGAWFDGFSASGLALTRFARQPTSRSVPFISLIKFGRRDHMIRISARRQ